MNPQKPNTRSFLQNKNRYDQGRGALLAVVILSLVNLISVTLSDVYFLFSSYVTQLFAFWGALLYLETQAVVFPVIFGIIGLITVVPYFLCYLFSKKRAGWMIAAFVLFGVDSLIFLVDFISLISVGEISMLMDLVIRIWVIVSLAQGVKYGLRVKKDEEEGIASEQDDEQSGEDAFDEMASVTRTITVTREKSFAGCALKLFIFTNGKEQESLKNGETQTVQIDGRECELVIMAANGAASDAVKIPAGYEGKRYTVKCKTGMTQMRILIEETSPVQ